jgi:hypothetical protein
MRSGADPFDVVLGRDLEYDPAPFHRHHGGRDLDRQPEQCRRKVLDRDGGADRLEPGAEAAQVEVD